MEIRRLFLIAWVFAGGLAAQQLFDSSPGSDLHFHPSDHAILSGDTNRSDLGCRVEPLKPRLGFDLKYTAGFVVRVPAEAVAPSGDALRAIFRVRALESERDPVYFQQVFWVPADSADPGSRAVFPARYVLGPGNYKVDWLMRNRRGTVCSAHWVARAPAPGHTGRLAAAAPSNLIAPYRQDIFANEPPVSRANAAGNGLHVSVLLNLAPLDRTKFKLSSYEMESVVGMLRSLYREPSIGLFSLRAFNAIDRKLVHSAQRQSRLDFEALGLAIDSMQPGVIEAAELEKEKGESAFLASLLNETLGDQDPPDAVIALGPKVDRKAQIPQDLLQFGADPGRLFQIAFQPTPHSHPWPGAIESALRPHGLTVYGVTLPQDYTRALEAMLGSIVDGEPGDNSDVAGSGISETGP